MVNLIEDVTQMINKVNTDKLFLFDKETNLLENGILDSLGIANMIMMIEEKYQIEISPEDVIPENFIDVSSIAGMIERYE